MNTHADKTQGNKIQPVANVVPQRESGDTPSFQFIDNRPESAAQRKLQEMANNSPRAKQSMAFQETANKSLRVRQTAQFQAMADNSAAQHLPSIQKKQNETGLPDALKSGIEYLSGHSMNDVKLHYDSAKPAQLQAHAFVQGTDIHLASGQEKHLPHEAWHVVQQKQGRVKPTVQMAGGVEINDDVVSENEADAMGAKAVASSEPVSQLASSGAAIDSGVVQLVKFERFQGWKQLYNWFQNPQEDELLAKEKEMEEFLDSMAEYGNTPDGAEIPGISAEFQSVKSSTVDSSQYPATLAKLKRLFYRLDGISARIAKKGWDYEKGNAAEVADWIEEGGEGPKSRKLVYYIQETYALLPAVLQTDENKAVIKESILGELHHDQLTDQYISDGHMAFAKKRVSLLRKNFKKMIDRIRTDWLQICGALNITGNLRFVHLTGSDYHNDGQSVSLIETTTGDRAVYKPRSLKPDVTLEGRVGSVHSDLAGAGNGGGPALGTARFLEKHSENGEHYGYMEFMQKTPRLSVAEAANYYRRMGRMVVSTKMLGVNDLHQENILTGPGGTPIIIDAETSFLPDVMMSDAWNKTIIKDALISFEKNGKTTPNFFYTPEDEHDWRAQGHEGPPDRDFIQVRRRASYRAGGRYQADFEGGVTEVLNFVSANEDAVTAFVKGKAREVRHVRLVPLATATFNGALSAYNSPDDRENVLRVTSQDIIDSLTTSGYQMAGGHLAIIKAGLAADFGNTDIPLFHYEPQDDHVYYRGRVVATHVPGIAAAIEANVHRISQATVLQVRAAFA